MNEDAAFNAHAVRTTFVAQSPAGRARQEERTSNGRKEKKKNANARNDRNFENGEPGDRETRPE